MLVEIIEVNNTKTIDLHFATDGKIYEIPSFEMRNPLAEEYEQWIEDNIEEYLDKLFLSYSES